MKNKIIIIPLFMIMVFLLYSNKVSANTGWDLEISGDIDTSENIIIARITNNGHELSIERYITGDFNVDYYESGQLESDNYSWLYYSGTYLYSYGYDIQNEPLHSISSSLIAYRIIVTDLSDDIFCYGYLDIYGEQKYYNNVGERIYGYTVCPVQLSSYINSTPRNYNGTESVLNGSTITSNINCANDYYFSKLTTNFGLNQYGSCGFISIASLLTYNDFFNNNYFINDNSYYYNNYCNNFPFIKYVTDNYFSTNDFYVSPGYYDSFQYYLIDEIAINNLEMSFDEEDGSPIYSTYYITQKQILENYIQTVATNISSNDYSVISLTTETNILSQLDLGRPVILDISSYEYENSQGLHIETNRGHSVIAYGYKVLSNGEVIYRCHLGWRNSSYFSDVLLKIIDDNPYGVSLIYTGSTNNCNDNVYLYNHGNGNCFGICHKHSGYDYYLDKEIYSSSIDKYYCPECSSYVLSMPHIHGKSYTWYNLFSHYVTCPCGYNGYESHVIGSGPFLNGYYKCIYCHGFMDDGNIHNKINPPYRDSCHE